MNPIEAIISVFRNYINFSGRAGRPEFWWFTLFAIATTALLIFVPFIGFIYVLALLLPSLAVTVRRLHDRDQSGWWAIASFFPFLNWALLIYLAFPGTPGPNRYGPEPQQQWGSPGQGSPPGPQGQPYQPPPMPGIGSYPPASTPPTGGQEAAPANSPEGEARTFCSQCGMQIQEEARFCALCGAAV